MSALTDLKAAWTARLASISDAVVRAEATYLLENYIAAYQQQAALEASTIQSYSIGGRSVTRRTIADGREMVSSMRAELDRYCYGAVSLLDMNTADEAYS